MPTGTLSFNSGGSRSTSWRLRSRRTRSATTFFLDNITVTTAALPARTVYTARRPICRDRNLGYATVWRLRKQRRLGRGAIPARRTWSRATDRLDIKPPHAIVEPGGISTGGISTGGAAAHSGSWGGFSLPHGNSDGFNPTDPAMTASWGRGARGRIALRRGRLVSGPLGGRLAMIIDGDQLHPIDLGAFAAAGSSSVSPFRMDSLSLSSGNRRPGAAPRRSLRMT